MPVDEESENALPVSGMNRELLSKAEDMGTSRVQRGHTTFDDPFYTMTLQIKHLRHLKHILISHVNKCPLFNTPGCIYYRYCIANWMRSVS